MDTMTTHHETEAPATPEMWVTIDGKLLASAQEMVVKPNTRRPLLERVFLQDRHLSATNGHILIRSPLPDAILSDGVTTPHPVWAIDRATVKAVGLSGSLRVDLATGRAEVKGKDGTTVFSVQLDKNEGVPDLTMIFPKGAVAARLSFNPDYLITVAKAAKATRSKSVTLAMTEGDVSTDGCRRAVAWTDDTGRAIGLVMPMLLP